MQPFTGSGPGIQAPDGCSVDLYRRIPYLGELDAVLPRFAPGAHVLELGCGTGRLCAALLDAGFTVTGVDNSPAMLAATPRAMARIAADIETLDLGRSFDGVLLASALVNHGVPASRRNFLAAARRHCKHGGVLALQRHDAAWLRTAAVGATSAVAGITLTVERVERNDAHVAMTLRYTIGSDAWRHHFEAIALDEPDIETLLAAAGFVDVRWHGEDRLWATACAG